MYTQYFGLTEKPFAISPDPRYLFMSEKHREALAHLLYGIESDGCIFLLTGDVGTGKTTICRCLLNQLPARTDVAVILNPKLTARDLLSTICDELDIAPQHNNISIKAYIDIINKHLLRSHAEGRVTALIIDEAQNLDVNVLEQLRLLTNLETDSHKLLQIFLIGQPELATLLGKKSSVQINQRITGRYHLAPLNPKDVKAYIEHRLKVAGSIHETLFTDRAIRHAVKITRGIPRLINVVCDRALLGAYAENSSHVDFAIMKQAGKEVFPRANKTFSFTRREIALGTTLLGLLLMVAFLLPRFDFSTLRQHEDSAEQVLVISEQPVAEVENQDSPITPIIQEEAISEENDPVEQTSEVAELPPPPSPQPPVEPVAPAPETKPLFTSPVDPFRPKQPDLAQGLSDQETPPADTPERMQEVKEPGEGSIIKISAPLIVLEQAGPTPQEKVMELILR